MFSISPHSSASAFFVSVGEKVDEQNREQSSDNSVLDVDIDRRIQS